MASTEFLILPLPTATLVFGLQWLPLLGGKAGRLAPRLARQHRATHMVFAGDASDSVGIVSLKTGRAQRKTRLHSAAQNIAQLFSTGTVALLLELEQAGYWLVAVHEGAVIARTDRLYRSSTDAQLVLSELRQAYPQLVLLGDAHAPQQPSLGLIEAASSNHSLLRLLRRWTPVLPWPVQVFFLSLVLVLLVPRLWDAFGSTPYASVRQVDDPSQAWRSALEKSTQGRAVHGVQGMHDLLQALHQLPVRVGGWALQEAECRPKPRKWRCLARYTRATVQASNLQFLSAAPVHWLVEFDSIEQARPTWEVNAQATPLQLARLKSSADHERNLFSSLQAIRPAFSQMQIGQPQSLPLSAPTDNNGHALPRPPGLLTYFSRSVRLVGPLRSASVMLPYAESIEWTKAQLTLRDVDQPGLKSSNLSLSLQGNLYETEVLAVPGHAAAVVSPEIKADSDKVLD